MKKFLLLIGLIVCFAFHTKAEEVTFQITCNNTTKPITEGVMLKITGKGDSITVNNEGKVIFDVTRGEIYNIKVYDSRWRWADYMPSSEIFADNIVIPESGIVNIDLGWEINFIGKKANGAPFQGIDVIVFEQESSGYAVARGVTNSEGDLTLYLRSEEYEYGYMVDRYYLTENGMMPLIVRGEIQNIEITIPDLNKVTFKFGNKIGMEKPMTLSCRMEEYHSSIHGSFQDEDAETFLYLPQGTFIYSLTGSLPFSTGTFVINANTTEIEIPLPNVKKRTFKINPAYDLYSFMYDLKGGDVNHLGGNNDILYCPPGEYEYTARLWKDEGCNEYFYDGGIITIADDDEEIILSLPPSLNKITFQVKNNSNEDFPYYEINVYNEEAPNPTFGYVARAFPPEYLSGWTVGKGDGKTGLPPGSYKCVLHKSPPIGSKVDTIMFSIEVTSAPEQTFEFKIESKMVTGKVTDLDNVGIYGSVAICPVKEIDGVKKLGKIDLINLRPDGTFMKELEAGTYYFQGRGHTIGFLNGYYLENLTEGRSSPLNWSDATLVDISENNDIHIKLTKVSEISGTGTVGFDGIVVYEEIKQSGRTPQAVMARPVAYATIVLYGKSKTGSKSTLADDYQPIAKAEIEEGSDGKFSFGRVLPNNYLYKLHVEFPTYTMIADFELDPQSDGTEVYDINFYANESSQEITSDYSAEVITYTVSFAGAGIDISAKPITRGGLVSKPDDPIFEGYEFKGWYFNNLLWDFDTPVTSDIILTAKWIAIVLGYNDMEQDDVVKLYPNPATDLIYIIADENTTYTIRIFNILGQLVKMTNGNSIESVVDISTLRSGIYFVKIETGGEVKTLKLIKDN